MRHGILLLAVITLVGCGKREAGAPVEFAPQVTFDEAPEKMPGAAEPEKKSDEAAADQSAAPSEEGSGSPADDEPAPDSVIGGEDRSESKEERMQDSDGRGRPASAKRSASVRIECDATCKKHCDAQVDQQACAVAYNAGCFAGTAPATFDCGKFKASPAEKSTGVELQTTPNVDY